MSNASKSNVCCACGTRGARVLPISLGGGTSETGTVAANTASLCSPCWLAWVSRGTLVLAGLAVSAGATAYVLRVTGMLDFAAAEYSPETVAGIAAIVASISIVVVRSLTQEKRFAQFCSKRRTRALDAMPKAQALSHNNDTPKSPEKHLGG